MATEGVGGGAGYTLEYINMEAFGVAAADFEGAVVAGGRGRGICMCTEMRKYGQLAVRAELRRMCNLMR